jgi:hypothetical protein
MPGSAMKTVCIALMFALFAGAVAYAELKVTIRRGNVSIDSSGFPPEMRAAYRLMMRKCSKCHSIERVVVSAQTGICTVSRTAFSKETTKAIVTRMYLKPESDMTRREALTIWKFLDYLLDQKVTVVERVD